MTKSLAIAHLPIYQNPYQHLLTDALGECEVTVEHLRNLPSPTWLLQKRNSIQILHLHWLSGLYMKRILTPLRFCAFLLTITLAQRMGYKIVWTVHNILPHKLLFPPMHRFVRRFIMKRADAVITHCEYGYKEITRLFPRDKPTYTIPIGSYTGIYPIRMTRAEARSTLNISPVNFVYLFLGNIAPYKGIDNFTDMFQVYATENDVAVIAGRNRSPDLVHYLESQAIQDPRIRIHADFIPDNEIQHFLLSADVMVLPFKKILTSSSVITGMSHTLPIIAPALGCLPELITPEAGILYDPSDPAGLPNALREIKNLDTVKMGTAAKVIIDNIQWKNIASQTIIVYRKCLNET